MKIFESRKLTDAEFVEQTCENLQRSKRLTWLWFSFSILFFILFFWLLHLVVSWISHPTDFQTDQWHQIDLKIVASGSSLETAALFMAIFSFSQFSDSLFSNRRDKLLVTYYDQLHPLNK
jgi:hypothetical protein